MPSGSTLLRSCHVRVLLSVCVVEAPVLLLRESTCTLFPMALTFAVRSWPIKSESSCLKRAIPCASAKREHAAMLMPKESTWPLSCQKRALRTLVWKEITSLSKYQGKTHSFAYTKLEHINKSGKGKIMCLHSTHRYTFFIVL